MTAPSVVASRPADVAALRAMTAASFRRHFEPQPRLTVSQWMERHRYLSPETSAEPGLFSFDRTPYLREIADAMGDLRYRMVVVKKPSQVGYTELLNSFVAYCMAADPSGMLMVQPTVDLAKQWTKERLKPMIRDTPVLAAMFGESSGRREAEDTLQFLKFPGGYLAMQGANSPAGLASRPLRRAFADEVNRWPANVGGEGSGIGLIQARLSTFWNSLLVAGSSPGDVGASLITDLFEQTDQRLYVVPCHDCRETFRLRWRDESGEYLLRCDKHDDGTWRPETAFYPCPHCGSPHTEREKPALLKAGEWVPQAPQVTEAAGFQIDGLMSPWVSWPAVLRKWGAAKANDDTRRVFVNTVIGEDYAPPTQALAATGLMARAEPLEPWPAWVGAYGVGVDLQGDRWEWLPVGFGGGECAALLAPRRHYGVIDDVSLTREVADAIAAGLGGLAPAGVMVDTGFRPEIAWGLVDLLKARGIRAYGGKGMDGKGRPMIAPPSAQGRKGVRAPWLIGTDTTEESVDARLRAEPTTADGSPGAGKWVALSDALTAEDVEQLTAAVRVKRQVNGRTVWVWSTPPGRRNEVRDCFRYAIAAVHARGVRFVASLGQLAAERPAATAPSTSPTDAAVAAPPTAMAPRIPAVPRRFRSLRL